MVEWHGALGHPPGTFSAVSIGSVLPQGYGRYLTAMMTAHLMHEKTGMPLEDPIRATPDHRQCLEAWAIGGFEARPVVRDQGELMAPVAGDGTGRWQRRLEKREKLRREEKEPEETLEDRWPVDSRVRVRYQEPEKWFSGTVVGSRIGLEDNRLCRIIKVVYDADGVVEEHSLSNTRVRPGHLRRTLWTRPGLDLELTASELQRIAAQRLEREQTEQSGEQEVSSSSESEADQTATSSDEDDGSVVGKGEASASEQPVGPACDKVDNPLDITQGDQLEDPWTDSIIRDLVRTGDIGPTDTPDVIPARLPGNRNWAIHDGLLMRVAANAAHETTWTIAVPRAKRWGIMAHFHYQSHRGAQDLVQDLQQRYYWPSMEADCRQFKAECQVCGERASVPRPQLPHQYR